jgi:hypothetical protein
MAACCSEVWVESGVIDCSGAICVMKKEEVVWI